MSRLCSRHRVDMQCHGKVSERGYGIATGSEMYSAPGGIVTPGFSSKRTGRSLAVSIAPLRPDVQCARHSGEGRSDRTRSTDDAKPGTADRKMHNLPQRHVLPVLGGQIYSQVPVSAVKTPMILSTEEQEQRAWQQNKAAYNRTTAEAIPYAAAYASLSLLESQSHGKEQ